MKHKVFVIGDSRTGTSSLHNFLKALGYSSIHYYLKEANIHSPDHENRNSNWQKLKRFVESSGYNAFSDYPTRLYYRELFVNFPDSYFILTVRKDTKIWRRSMENYFTKFGMDLNYDELQKQYITINNQIEEYFMQNEAKYLKICIDDNDQINSRNIKKFLNVDLPVAIGWENKSRCIDTELVSRRKILYDTSDENWLDYVKQICNPHKVMLSEKGWMYLINDENDYMSYLYGNKKWKNEELAKAKQVLDERIDILKRQNIHYLKFIIPEKANVYPEFMPNIFDNKKQLNKVPAFSLSEGIESVSFLRDYLRDLKGYGDLHFRGDSHANWRGAYFIYLYIIEKLNKLRDKFKLNPPIALSQMNIKLAAYKGDLYEQASDLQKADVHGVWKNYNIDEGFGYDIFFNISKDFNKVHDIEIPNKYKKYSTKRPLFIKENINKELPQAVIFRDSTCDFIVDLLAQHFSRSVFIWHKGNVYKDVINNEKPDIVLHIMAERFVSDYFRKAPIS